MKASQGRSPTDKPPWAATTHQPPARAPGSRPAHGPLTAGLVSFRALSHRFNMESDADLTPYLACAKSAKAAYTRSSARTNSSSTKSFAADADSPSGNSLHSSMASKAARVPTTAGNPATPQPMAGSARLGREILFVLTCGPSNLGLQIYRKLQFDLE